MPIANRIVYGSNVVEENYVSTSIGGTIYATYTLRETI